MYHGVQYLWPQVLQLYALYLIKLQDRIPMLSFSLSKRAAVTAFFTLFTLFILVTIPVYLAVIVSQTCKNTLLLSQAAAVYILPSSVFA